MWLQQLPDFFYEHLLGTGYSLTSDDRERLNWSQVWMYTHARVCVYVCVCVCERVILLSSGVRTLMVSCNSGQHNEHQRTQRRNRLLSRPWRHLLWTWAVNRCWRECSQRQTRYVPAWVTGCFAKLPWQQTAHWPRFYTSYIARSHECSLFRICCKYLCHSSSTTAVTSR